MVRIELHRRPDSVKLLGCEVVDSILTLSDEDVLGEKLYYARCTPRDVFDVKLLLKKIGDPVEVLRRKYSEPVDKILLRLKRNCPEIYRLL